MNVLVAAVISESLLVVIAFILARIFSLAVPWNVSSDHMWVGAALTIPPLMMNEWLWYLSSRYPNSIYARFSREVIVPLCRQVSVPVAAAIAILSGACEELLFRGTLHTILLPSVGPLLTCIISSVLFALVHFIGTLRRYGGMLPIYIFMGAYLWSVYYLTGSLFCVAITHGLYNFIVIVRVKAATR